MVAPDYEFPQVVQRSLFDGNGDVHALAAPSSEKNERQRRMRIDRLGDGFLRKRAEIAVRLVKFADLFEVRVELVFIVGAVKNPEPRRQTNGLRIFHSLDQRGVAEDRIPFEANLADLYLRTLNHNEG